MWCHQLKRDCTLKYDRISIVAWCKHTVSNIIALIKKTKGFLITYALPANFQCVGFVITSHLSAQLFTVCGGIPGSSSRRSLSLACFMGTGGRTSQMVFLRNYYVLIHCERAGWLLPLFPPYWEVTVRLTKGRECMRNGEEGRRLMGDEKGGGI